MRGVATLALALLCARGPEPGPGEYDDGVYHCCAEGQGGDCCGGYEQGMCFEYGGIYGDCRPAGELIEGKVICGFCCEGSEMVEPMAETDQVYDGYPEGCGPGETTPSLLICVACGDGECGEGENRCRCPEDCDPS